jgi:hypothetical protein
MTRAAAMPVLGPDQILTLLRDRRSEWRRRYQLQRIGLYSFGEACGYLCHESTVHYEQ